MKAIMAILIMMTAWLQFNLWTGEGSIPKIWQLKKQIANQERENAKLRQRNESLELEVNALKSEPIAVEELARAELGMIRQGETFYQLVESPQKDESKQ